MPKRIAILVGNGTYGSDSGIPQLAGPINDVRILGDLFANPAIGAFNDVIRLVDKDSREVSSTIERILNNASRDDLVLIYYSGHGKLDVRGELCITTRDTHCNALRSTSIPLQLLSSIINDSPSNGIVIVLDCCYSGAAARAFVRGTFDDQMSLLGGAGRHIISASTGIQTAREREQRSDGIVMGEFSRVLAQGLRTGDADLDADGFISVMDAFEFVRSGLRGHGQQPQHWGFRTAGRLVIARSITPSIARAKVAEVDGGSEESSAHENMATGQSHSTPLVSFPAEPTFSSDPVIDNTESVWDQLNRIAVEVEQEIALRATEVARLPVARQLKWMRWWLGQVKRLTYFVDFFVVATPILSAVLLLGMPVLDTVRYTAAFICAILGTLLGVRYVRTYLRERIATSVSNAERAVSQLETHLSRTPVGAQWQRLEALRGHLLGISQQRFLGHLDMILALTREWQTRRKHDVASIIAEKLKAERQFEADLKQISEWRDRAAKAVAAGREDLAFQALEHVRRHETLADRKRPKLDRMRVEADAETKKFRQVGSAVEEMDMLQKEAKFFKEDFVDQSPDGLIRFCELALFIALDRETPPSSIGFTASREWLSEEYNRILAQQAAGPDQNL